MLSLEVNNLTVAFGKGENYVRAVDGISFCLEAGKTLGIVGESGSGKSVTSLSLLQLIPEPLGRIEQGEARLTTKGGATVDLLQLSQRQIRKFRGNDIAMIFQEPMTSLNPVFTCGYQVAETLRLHRHMGRADARRETIRLFELVRLPRAAALYDSYPHQLSGGQKQRVMIAMAIACQPRVLIADEPTTALDVTVQAGILDLLNELQRETGMAMIFITHDLGVISRIAHDVMVMYRGKAVEQGSVEQIFQSPQHPYTRGLLACRPARNFSLRRLPVITDFMHTGDDGQYSETGLSVEDVRFKIGSKDAAPSVSPVKTEPLIKVENLKVMFPADKSWFGKPKHFVKAVDDVSFEVFPGETLGLVGESGCGKTTLGRALLRLIEPGSGRVCFEGEDICGYAPRELRALRKRMQLIFQDPYSSLNPRITAGQSILEPMQVHQLYGSAQERKEKVLYLLKRVGLKEAHFHRYPHQFSGGQRQRICIARALALNPSFVICDESVSALDVSVQAQVLNLLNELKEEQGLTYIFISHDLSVVRYMSDRIMVMNKGRIEELGQASEVYDAPKSAYTRGLLDAIPH